MQNKGWFIIIGLTMIPVVIWSRIMPLSERFTDLVTASTSIGQLAGITGLVLFSCSMILSTRLKLFESWFGGMNRVYIVHHQIGGISLLLLLLHPLALSILYATDSFRSAAFFLFPGSDWTINLGISSLLTLIALLVLTYYADLPYELWRFTHKFLGIAFLLGGLHSFFIPSDISINPALRWYLISITVISLLGYLYRTILGRWLVKRYEYTITAVNILSDAITELKLEAKGNRLPPHKPGQFVFIALKGKNVPHEAHPFSISSTPNDAHVSLTIKALGDYSKWVTNIKSGALCTLEGPYGRFSPDFFRKQNTIWIAGGIGITPFLSMARTLKKNETTVDLYYCVRNEKEAICNEELIHLAKADLGLRYIPWYSETQGRLSAEKLHEISNVNNKGIFLCGPPAMIRTLKHQLKNIGISKSNIYTEEFDMS